MFTQIYMGLRWSPGSHAHDNILANYPPVGQASTQIKPHIKITNLQALNLKS